MERITNSKLTSHRACPRKHSLAYEYLGTGIRAEREADALSIGRVIHEALENKTIPQAPAELTLNFIIAEKLTEGYYRYWADENIQILEREKQFEIPLINPATGRKSRKYTLGGKIDAIIKTEDEKIYIMEHKTTSDNITPDSDYWRRLFLDTQISMYYLALRHLGYNIQGVIYDVIKKPTIRQKQNETLDEFRIRLKEDILARPEWYFARQEISRTEQDLLDFQADIWEQVKVLYLNYRNPSNCNLFGKCEFFDICSIGFKPDGSLPAGYIKKEHSMKGELNV